MKRRALASSAIVFFCTIARAQSADQALAQSLFDQANQLAEAGNYAEACPKFAESQRLDPGGGTLINLGLCLEKEKKLASAWSAFNDALAWALKDGNQTREQIAREHIAAIEPKLIRITIDVRKEAQNTPGLDVTYDGVPIRPASWGVPTATDAGPHLVLATAPGKLAWRLDLDLAEDVLAQNVIVPALADEPKPEAPRPIVSKKETKRSIVPWVLGGAALAGLAVGTIGAVAAFSEHSIADSECKPAGCTQRGIDREAGANNAAWVANIGFIAGAVLAGAAVVVYIVDSGKKRSPTALVPGFTF